MGLLVYLFFAFAAFAATALAAFATIVIAANVFFGIVARGAQKIKQFSIFMFFCVLHVHKLLYKRLYKQAHCSCQPYTALVA